MAGSLERADDIGAWALARQQELGGRFRIAVIAAGAARADGSPRFAVEDLLAAGAIIEAIAAVGIDHQSPEAASAAAAYTGLRSATRHLISASETSRELRGG
jgi:2-phosphosulfolactate phosphatase